MWRIAIAVLAGCSFVAVHGPPPVLVDRAPVECTSGYGWVKADAVGAALSGAVTGIGVWALVSCSEGHIGPCPPAGLALLAPVALLYGVATVYGIDNVRACRHAEQQAALDEEAAEAAQARARRRRALEQRAASLRDARERAAALTKDAAAAARRGDCASVKTLDTEIDAIDREFHDVVFAHDAAIARCLAPVP